MSGSYTETSMSIAEHSPHDYQPSTRYISTLKAHSPSRRASSAISKSYKAASTLYLTRRLPEALHTIEPLVTPARPSPEDGRDTDGNEILPSSSLPPIATATRSLRIKVWNFYLTLLNAIIELGPEEGKADFGGAVWRGIVAKVRDGSVWEEVVASGYSGREGGVDADVVANLSTLLLGQSPSQALNQRRLETYLSLSGQPELVLADRLSGFAGGKGDGLPEMQRRPSHASGTNTPRDLNSRAKVLELYTLHVLPRNDEWETSREFIRNSNELDDERKDAFLYTLDTLQDQARTEHDREQELLRQRDEEMARQRAEAEAKRIEESRLLEERSRASEAATSVASSSRGLAPAGASPSLSKGSSSHNRANSEIDYGIDDSRVAGAKRPSSTTSASSSRKKESSSKALRGGGGGTGGHHGRGGSGGREKGLPRASTARPKKAGGHRQQPRASAAQRIPIVLGLLRRMLAGAARGAAATAAAALSTRHNDPLALARNLLFVLALLLAVASRAVRGRIARAAGIGWAKMRATIGMGTKVSYI